MLHIGPSCVILVALSSSACGVNKSSTNTTSVGIQLAQWKYEEYYLYLGALLLLTFVYFFKTFYPKIPWLPDLVPQSLVLILFGVAYGAILLQVLDRKLEETMWELTPDIFFDLLLPPIVLDAAYSLNNRTFMDFLGSILILAVFGTIMNFLIIGPVMYGIQLAGAMGSAVDFTFNDYLLFSSLIVAVDPIAVLAIFQELGVHLGLYFMVFGESLLNDAVTVVLYNIMKEFVKLGDDYDMRSVGLGIGSFFTVSLGGLTVGVIFGAFTSIGTRWTTHFASVFIIFTAYFAYIMGECLGWSGIIAMVGCGLVQASYAFHNISRSCRITVKGIVKQISETSESVIFFYIGIQLFTTNIEWNTGFCLWGLVTSFFTRGIVIFLLCFLINLMRINNVRISLKEQIILIYGGLRGAVCLALATLVDYPPHEVHKTKLILTGTLFIILMTVVPVGLTMKPLARMFKIKLAGSSQLSLFVDMFDSVFDHTLAGIEAIVGARGRNRIRQIFTRLDDRFVRRLLQTNPETHDQRITQTYEKIALKLHFASINSDKFEKYLKRLPETTVRKHLIESESSVVIPKLKLELVDTGNEETPTNPTCYRKLLTIPRKKPVFILPRRYDSINQWNAEFENFTGAYLETLRRKSDVLEQRHTLAASESEQEDSLVLRRSSMASTETYELPTKDYPP